MICLEPNQGAIPRINPEILRAEGNQVLEG